MTRSRPSRSPLSHWALLLLALACAKGREPSPLVLVTVDTLRADHLSCYGYFRPTAPVLCGLAESGILFENAFAPMAMTLPSHISLMTSQNPLRHRVFGNFKSLGASLATTDELRSAAEMLSARGYATAAFVSATPVGAHSGLSAGFDVFDEPEGHDRLAEETTDLALQWLQAVDSRPFFLWVHYWDPHYPYQPPVSFSHGFEVTPSLVHFLEAKGVRPIDAEVLAANNLYDAEILYVDRQLGRLLAALERAGLRDRPAIVLTADHGEGLGQHGWMGHGLIYNEQLRVPLVIKLPEVDGAKRTHESRAGDRGTARRRTGARRREIVSLIDVLPTVLGALDVSLGRRETSQFEGIDLLAGGERRYVLSQRDRRERKWGEGDQYALTSLEWKYVHDTAKGDALYDMVRDPNETRNLVEVHPEIAADMLGRLRESIAAYESAASVEGPTPELPADVIEKLESLGYVR